MGLPVRVCGIGVARSPGDEAGERAGFAGRVAEAMAAVSQPGAQVRLFHVIEEAGVVAARDALVAGGVSLPFGGDAIGVVVGVEEGIDGIKAEYFRGILKDGPLGASPIAFPFTTPNTIAARIAILLDLRGENTTVSGGNLSGAQALGLALENLRGGRCGEALAGGVTWVQPIFLDALAVVGSSESGHAGWGAGFLFLKSGATSAGNTEGLGQLLGYAEGVGKNDIRDAVQECLQDAGLAPERIASVRVASTSDPRSLVEALHRAGARVPILQSPSCFLYAASFPMAVAEVMEQATDVATGPVLVVGKDCLAGAAAAIVRRGGS